MNPQVVVNLGIKVLNHVLAYRWCLQEGKVEEQSTKINVLDQVSYIHVYRIM